MPVKHQSPLLGYNNNVRHKGKVFHVQTEDSGVKYGHIITHLFMDGGRILKSVKTGYSEYVDNDRMGEIVREMMKQQHKAMFIALRDGKFDSIIEGADASQSTQSFPAATPAAPPSAGDSLEPRALEGADGRTARRLAHLPSRGASVALAAGGAGHGGRGAADPPPGVRRAGARHRRRGAGSGRSQHELALAARVCRPPPAPGEPLPREAGRRQVPRDVAAAGNRSGSRRGAASFGLPDSGGQGRARRCRPPSAPSAGTRRRDLRRSSVRRGRSTASRSSERTSSATSRSMRSS